MNKATESMLESLLLTNRIIKDKLMNYILLHIKMDLKKMILIYILRKYQDIKRLRKENN